MNVVPTRATRHLGDRMVREATSEFGCGADAVLECFEDVRTDQVAALLGYILDRCRPAEVEIVVEPARPAPREAPDYGSLVAVVLDEVAATFPVTVKELLAPIGGRQVAEARHVAMWLLRHHGMPYAAIGAQLGGRDHSTIMYGVAKVDESERLRGIAVDIQQWIPDVVEAEDCIDESAIYRRTNGDKTVRLTQAERAELVRRWATTGRSLAECERITGLNPQRYRLEVAS